MLRVLIFEDQTLYRIGLRGLIGEKIPVCEVAEANTLSEALSHIRKGGFELVLIGAAVAGLGQIESLNALREASPSTRFAIISASDSRADILAGLAAGFHGFISKHQSDDAILAAINDILSGRIYVPRSLAEPGEGDAPGSRSGGEALPMLATEVDVLKLTARQCEVLSLLAHGKSNKEIARALDIAEATTKIHMAALLRALGVRNRTEAAYKSANLLGSRGVRLIPAAWSTAPLSVEGRISASASNGRHQRRGVPA